MTKNAYVHIPFCKSKCGYCSFVSYPQEDKVPKYLECLKREIKYFYKGEPLSTLYFGGGTPSLLSVEQIKAVVELFELEQGAEITIELNPETLTQAYFEGLKEAGINRISMGCQTFNDEVLRLIGRRHNSKQVEVAVSMAQNSGFENISLDFIYGLPTQTLSGFVSDLNHAVELGVEHISLYGLKIEEGSRFFKNRPENLPDEDLQADMYLAAIECLKSNDFEHYEISNFSKSGYNSRHNLNYWNNNSYYGFGIAAHGYVDGIRYSNYRDFENYFKNPTEHAISHKLTEQEVLEEEIFLGFRRMDGVDFSIINKKFEIDFEKKYSEILKKYYDYGMLEKTDAGCKLTDSGILVSNVILAEFLQ